MALLVMVVIAGLLVAAGFFVLSKFTHLSLFNPAGCTLSADGAQASLALDQTQNAALIAAVGRRLGVPAFGIEVAEATAQQESKLRNVDYGDRDSVGLFQQRPSQGWGTSAQILDPVYASTKFFQALTKIPGWQNLSLADAAQAVQRSADGSAYGDHQQEATVLAAVFTGAAGSGLTCTLDGPTFAPQSAGSNGLTAQATAFSAAFENQIGTLSPQNVSAGGSAFDIPVPGSTTTTGWSYANWSVAQAESLGVVTVTYDGKTWSAAQGSAGWQTVADGAANPGEVQIAMTTAD
ncbi:MAG TPA: hypothetical protein VGX23_06210 [Actinocrinis sp.]|nr:hypothetical protein [Actinocrinis sp.]